MFENEDSNEVVLKGTAISSPEESRFGYVFTLRTAVNVNGRRRVVHHPVRLSPDKIQHVEKGRHVYIRGWIDADRYVVPDSLRVTDRSVGDENTVRIRGTVVSTLTRSGRNWFFFTVKTGGKRQVVNHQIKLFIDSSIFPIVQLTEELDRVVVVGALEKDGRIFPVWFRNYNYNLNRRNKGVGL